tara:strand:+ start:295 stop:570 length:276 start_codon:yes stop_codon:yes gene_type:complete
MVRDSGNEVPQAFRGNRVDQGETEPSTPVPPRAKNFMKFIDKVRPQIILAILVLGIVSVVALIRDGDQYIAVVTGATGGIIALGMKLLDGE